MPDLERVGAPVGRHGPGRGEVADEFRARLVGGIDAQQRAVLRRARMEHREGLFLVRVEARRLGGDDVDQLTTVARLVLGGARRGREQQERERDRDRTDERSHVPSGARKSGRYYTGSPMKPTTKTVVALPGEGIGVEVVDAACEILSGAGLPLTIATPTQVEAPGAPVPEATKRACRE